MERARGEQEQYYCGALNVTPKIGHGLVLFSPRYKALRLSYKNMKIIAQKLPKYHVRGAHSAATTLFSSS